MKRKLMFLMTFLFIGIGLIQRRHPELPVWLLLKKMDYLS